MSYTFTQAGSEIQAILDRAEAGGQIDQDIAAKQDALTFDDAPTSGSDNPVKSGGIYDAIQAGGATALAAFATDSVSGDVVSFPDGADGIPVKSFSGTIVPLQSGSGDPAPDNIRPISGWSGAEIYRTGVNVWDEEWENGYYDNGVPASGTGIRSKAANYIAVKPNTAYYCKCGASANIAMSYYDASQAYISNYVVSGGSGTFTTPSNCFYLRFHVASSYGSTYNNDISINYPSTDTTYHAYDGQTITLTFGSTVYAGTITALGGGKWSIQPTHGIIDLGALSYTKTGGNLFRAPINTKADGVGTLVCSQYKYQSGGGFQTEDGCIGDSSNSSYLKQVFINDSARYNDTPEQFATAMSGVQLAYPLQTLPAPIIVSAEDLQTLLGANTVWTDVGSVAGMTYRADTALYIQKLLNGGTLQTLSMASPSPSLSLGRVGVLAEPEVAEPEQTEEEAEQLEQTGEPGQTEEA